MPAFAAAPLRFSRAVEVVEPDEGEMAQALREQMLKTAASPGSTATGKPFSSTDAKPFLKAVKLPAAYEASTGIRLQRAGYPAHAYSVFRRRGNQFGAEHAI